PTSYLFIDFLNKNKYNRNNLIWRTIMNSLDVKKSLNKYFYFFSFSWGYYYNAGKFKYKKIVI
ncbi:MAG: hypothetical protein ACOWWH_13865, partial [Eubacteriaceae bacterium]